MAAPAAPTGIYKWASETGEFKRQVSSFRNEISPDGPFPPEANRYHLYVSLACPWAHRTLIVRALKGLEDIISVSVVDPLMGPNGWHFSEASETPGAIPDICNGFKYIREVYFKAEPEYSGRFTVPVLWDKKNNTIVNNESSEIIRFFNNQFDVWSSNPGVTYYPENLRSQIDELNTWIYDQINNGVYKAGFASKQEPYEAAYNLVFDGLAKVEAILAKNKFLVGETLTEADVRLFTTIVRFDPVYHTHFKCTGGTITHDFPNILRWARQIYQMPKVAATVNMKHIKEHYYKSHLQINPFQVVPVWNGPDLSLPVKQ
ncbi:glutathione S-transferase [Cladochytrium replicatum]|nr:glutathione S-transferase [Cladochytrium replicatum]